ncbi:hypothetical protein FACS1894160_0670 [Bacteroidia bacterium]|nr:hypothetical protein FACS1894160_0670 [Bacteroidia bacterium]
MYAGKQQAAFFGTDIVEILNVSDIHRALTGFQLEQSRLPGFYIQADGYLGLQAMDGKKQQGYR